VKQPPRKKKDPIIAAVEPEVVQTPAPAPETSGKRPRTAANVEAEQRYKQKKDAERKAKSRATTIEQFWAASLKFGNAEKIAAWKVRQERVFDLMWYIEQHVKGTYDASPERDATLPEDEAEFVSVEHGDADLREDLAAHGQCSRNTILRAGKFWRNSEHMEKYNGDDANSVFARYGLLIGVPVDTVRDWDIYLREYRSQHPEPEFDDYVTLSCACGAQNAVHKSTANTYHSSGTEYRCPKCSDKSADVLDLYGRMNV